MYAEKRGKGMSKKTNLPPFSGPLFPLFPVRFFLMCWKRSKACAKAWRGGPAAGRAKKLDRF